MTEPLSVEAITKRAGIVALFACGHAGPSASAPAPAVAFARAFAAAVGGLAGASYDAQIDAMKWHTAPTDQIDAALYALARDGLIPGGASDPSATGYLFRQKGGGPTGRPSPRGRLAMARAAGADVRAIAVGKSDRLELTDDGDIAALVLHPDDRPVAWGDLRGVAVRITHDTGERVMAWVSVAEIGSRKDKSTGKVSGWSADAIGMACTKAISIAVARGIVPQASLLPSILGPARYANAIDVATLPHPAPAELPPPSAPAALAAQAEDEPAPPAEPEPDAPADDVAEQVAPVALPPGLYFDLAADAECGRDYAYEAITRAVDSLTAAGRPADEAALRAPPVWSRLIQRAAQIARDAADAGG